MSDPIEIAAKALADLDEYPDPKNHPVYFDYARAVIAALEEADYRLVKRDILEQAALHLRLSEDVSLDHYAAPIDPAPTYTPPAEERK